MYITGKPYIGNELPIMLQRGPNGNLDQRFISFIYQPTFDHRGDMSGIFVEGSDVTESVMNFRDAEASESELIAASRRKGELLAMLAHELRNPLVPIGEAAELLQRVTLDDERVRKTGAVIRR